MNKEQYTEKHSVKLSKEMDEWLQAYCSKNGVKMSKVLRKALTEFRHRRPKPPSLDPDKPL